MKKVPIMYVVAFPMAMLPAISARASVAADLSQAEGQYKAGQYAQAERSYLTVIQQADRNESTGADAAFNARKMLPLVYIATDRLPQAKDAVQQLLSRYAQSESLPRAIHEIVEGSKPLYKLAQVRQLYQDMVTARPADPRAIWLKMGVAIASVHLTDDPSTDSLLQDIIAQHGSDRRAAEALNQIAWACRNLKQYNKALTIYQYVVDKWPEKDRVAFAQHGIVMCQIGLGNHQEADAAFRVLVQKFGKDEDASKMVLWAGHGYSDAGEVEGLIIGVGALTCEESGGVGRDRHRFLSGARPTFLPWFRLSRNGVHSPPYYSDYAKAGLIGTHPILSLLCPELSGHAGSG